ncbi:virulence protein [Rhodanobacter sp. AS-Z3]|uniref:AcvB/VirJ family lysyl-phosphatidylglycerol hydrolase n=1 Tax=Rhodanobacter sp. AS-Z3 TaxID=3031330 RepID=UPI0024786184|nr:AcvB/VirJ family lysyl-phosphatidylglycerol hydrolase [Rhodanobacter sp. AS-Z3]WEN14177.1 virulence protein [Rhodanobacter sp. AS-Z3]
MLAVVGASVLGAVMMWHPWSRVSLEKATVVLPVAAISTAPPAGRDDVMAIIYSGDGGWADLDRRLGIAFIDRGIPVLGVNTFKYYWHERTPEQSAHELDALMTKYLGAWGKQRIWLVGFSFGADVLPTIVARLSPANRARITQLVLLSPSRDVTFEIELEGYMIKQGWFKEHLKKVLQHINPIQHYDALPPLQALQGQPPVVCYYGLDDADDSVCDQSGVPAWVTVHAKKGDHHFDGGYQPLTNQLLDELPAAAH